ncbi:hypothetical protein C8J56DRAFT_922599, partial [Mycena floridula]
MGRTKCWQWAHFHQGERSNSTHFHAICDYCTKDQLTRVEREERAAVDTGLIVAPRSKDLLIIDARSRVKPVTGKVAVMNNHLVGCDFCPSAIGDRVYSVTEVPKGFMASIVQYAERTGPFSEATWPVETLKSELANEDGSVDPIALWKVLDTEKPLVKLAIRLLSFVCDSASCEHLFTKWTDTKTKKQNQLGLKKTRDTVYVKTELRAQQAKAGMTRQRLKRQFGNPKSVQDKDKTGSRIEDQEILMEVSEEVAKPGESESDSEESDVDGPAVYEGWNNPGDAGDSERRGFDAVANHLEDRAADNDESDWDDDPDSDVPVSTLGNGQKVHLYFGKTVISLTDLFNWAVIDAEHHDFWVQGKATYDEETTFYELLSRTSTEHHDFWVQGKANYDEETTFYELLSCTSTDEPPPGEASVALLPVPAENAIEI